MCLRGVCRRNNFWMLLSCFDNEPTHPKQRFPLKITPWRVFETTLGRQSSPWKIKFMLSQFSVVGNSSYYSLYVPKCRKVLFLRTTPAPIHPPPNETNPLPIKLSPTQEPAEALAGPGLFPAAKHLHIQYLSWVELGWDRAVASSQQLPARPHLAQPILAQGKGSILYKSYQNQMDKGKLCSLLAPKDM